MFSYVLIRTLQELILDKHEFLLLSFHTKYWLPDL
jgi:hypothetical protein